METIKILNDDELSSIVSRVWENSKEAILKQVEYSISNELSDRARSRAKILIAQEVDAILKPKITAMRAVMESRAQQIANGVASKLDAAMKVGMENAIKDVSESTIRNVLSQAESQIRLAMLKALE